MTRSGFRNRQGPTVLDDEFGGSRRIDASAGIKTTSLTSTEWG